MKSITSREDVIQFLKDYNTPLLQCEFMMVISDLTDVNSVPDKVLLTAFDCPDSGIKWSAQQDKFGFVKANLQFSQMNVAFISPVENEAFSPIHKYYNAQFTEDGLIKAKNSSFAGIQIYALVEGTSHLLFKCSGCRFSYPIPAIDLSNPKTSVFKTVVSYNSFRYGL